MNFNFNLDTSEYKSIMDILNPILSRYPTAIVAGGAVRDMLLEKPIKDIDVYVQQHIPTSSGQWEKLLGLEPGTIKKARDKDDNEQHASEISPSLLGLELEICDVFVGYTDTKQEFNIIVTNVSEKYYVTEYFDIGLCKVWLDNYGIFVTNDFINDFNNKQLTICSKQMTTERMAYILDNHINRLQAKYPSYEVIIPEYNKQYTNSMVRDI